MKATDDTPQRVDAATRRELRNAFRGISLRGASVGAIVALDRARAMPHLNTAAYLRPARHECGGAVAERSWVALVWLPNAPFARIGAAAVYTVRTRSGWRPWLVWFPFDHTGYRLPRSS